MCRNICARPTFVFYLMLLKKSMWVVGIINVQCVQAVRILHRGAYLNAPKAVQQPVRKCTLFLPWNYCKYGSFVWLLCSGS
uniref:Secreted protein n=1 Tax=Globodera rostochiensis TaxID=31243 RepID=A0A914I5D4_GLORO